LVSLVARAGIFDDLMVTDTYTLFAPTDDAFALLGAEMLTMLDDDPAMLRTVLEYHMVFDEIYSADLMAGDLVTLEGRNVTVTLDPTMINDADIIRPDVFATNGVIHVIDRVLLPPSMMDRGTIVDVASSDSDFTTLVSLLESADLVDALNGAGPLTVFAPTNAAFEKLGAETLALLAKDRDLLRVILIYHVLPGNIPSRALSLGAVTTLDGRLATISSLDPLRINGVDIIKADIPASNGIIHVIDEVLIPPGTIAVIASLQDTFSTLADLLLEADLFGDLNGPGPLTVFAPTDEAFEKLGSETLALLANDSDLLVAVLTYHVVPGLVVPSGALMAGDVTTLEGSSVAITLNPPKVNDIDIIRADVFASNGVIHVIDEVLLPPSFRDGVENSSSDTSDD
jgi:transforming growth factor-beta-induced protein